MNIQPSEVFQGLGTYKEQMLREFGGANLPGAVGTDRIQTQLATMGFTAESAVVTVPYDEVGLTRATEITAESPWHDPYVAQRLSEVLAAHKNTNEDHKYPRAFHSRLLDLVVLFDYTDSSEEQFGRVATEGMFVDDAAFAFVLGSFAHLTKIIPVDAGKSGLTMTTTAYLSGVSTNYRFEPNACTVEPQELPWIDVGYASFASAVARESLHPASVPDGYWGTDELEQFGLDGALDDIPGRYLINTEDKSETPLGYSDGMVAGMGVEKLSRKWYELVDAAQGVAGGLLSRETFHEQLRWATGDELFRALVAPQPEAMWGPILQQIENM